ncbi:MAG: alpha/beta hydrolase [Lachnospiraceae bacterium]|nr:alpha/beta hydrolase [Lachnospiraceae bacterium]
MAKLSLKYRILRSLVKASGIKKKMFPGEEKELLDLAKKQAKNKNIPNLSHPDLTVTVKKFQGEDVVCFHHRNPSEYACLFLIGGGMVKYPRPASIKKALQIAVETGRDMIVPYYPLCIENDISVVYDWIYDLYKKIIEVYSADKVMVTGSSSGGNLALGLIAHINKKKEKLPYPQKIYVSSPGECLGSGEVRQKAKELDAYDVAISAGFMEMAEHFMRKNKTNLPDYMFYLEQGDFHGLSEVYLCYGSHEVLYSAYEPIKGALERDGVKVIAEIGEEMYHCYPFIPLCKEAKEGWERMIGYHKVI